MVLANLISRNFKNIVSINKRTISMDSYVWIDLEMTGLNLEKDTILEVACIITTPKLDPVHEGINLVVHQSNEVLKSMNSWCIEQHSKTGLTEASQNSNISLTEADAQVANYIKQHTDDKGIRYLAGNSVYMDKMFINKYMPLVDNLLHYRLIDVTSVKVLCSHWYPEKFHDSSHKKLMHRALDDIKDSILELKKYKAAIFK